MNTVSQPTPRYDLATILFHWLTVVLVVEQWIGAKTIDLWPHGELRVDARSIHITFGVFLGLLLIARIAWRLTHGQRLRGAESDVLRILAQAMHLALYTLLVATVILGLTLVSVRHDSLFGIFTMPSWNTATVELRHTIQHLHDLLATTLLVVAGLHASIALLHRYVVGDNVLARMIPRLG